MGPLDYSTSTAGYGSRFILPAGLDFPGVLGGLAHRADEGRYFINSILRKMVCRDLDPQGFARLHSDVLHKVLRRNTLAPMKRCLKAAGVISTSPHRQGVRSIGYRLTDRYLEQRHVLVRPVDPILIEKLERERKKLEAQQQKRQLPIHHRLASVQRCVTITAEADSILASLHLHTRLCQAVLIGYLRHRRLPFSVSSTGRIFNCITGIKRELRTAIRINGKSVASLDISCAQPALLGLLAQTFTPSEGLKGAETYKVVRRLAGSLLPGCSLPTRCDLVDSEVLRFSRWTCDGSFYDRLSGFCDVCLADAKRRFLVDVLAKGRKYPSDVEDAFRACFPSLWHFIKRINANDHGTLIRILQRMEAWLVIETVAPRLMGRIPIVTLHDAIFCGCDDIPVLEAVFEEVFGEIGFTPALKLETWGT